MSDPYWVVKMPFPLTPLSAFGYYLCRRLGLIDYATHVVYNWREKEFLGGMQSTRVLNLFGTTLHEVIVAQSTASDFSGAEKKQLTLMHLFLRDLGPQYRNRRDIDNLLRRLMVSGNPKPNLESLIPYIGDTIQHRLEHTNARFDDELLIPEFKDSTVADISSLDVPPDKEIITLPHLFKVSRGGKREKRKVIDWNEFSLNVGRVWRLTTEKIVILIGGPPESGKSTLAATLYTEINNLVQSLRSRIPWRGFFLNVKYVDLDRSTHCLSAIVSHKGQKPIPRRVWTLELAREALADLAEVKQDANIIIADLPGGDPDEITEIAGSLGDVGIIITRDWTKIILWKRLFANLGVKYVCRVLTDDKASFDESIVTGFYPPHRICGQMRLVDRVARTWDPFVSCLAKVLLFEILPTFVDWKASERTGIFHGVQKKIRRKKKNPPDQSH